MYKKNDTLYYADVVEGVVIKGKFIDYDNDNIWIKLPNEPINTFIYSDTISKIIFATEELANSALEELKKSIAQRLQNKTVLVEELFTKLKEHEGFLYANVLKEVLLNKIT